MDNAKLKNRINAVKARYGKELLILAHCYQQDEIVELADCEGDSFMLAAAGAKSEAKYIVFCGVRFMAESSVILAKKGQRVFMPDPDAGCPLADLADIEQVEDAWNALKGAGLDKEIIPVTYMNSSAELKAFCGRNDGIVCTSSNAAKAFDWVLSKKKRIFFFPDENLGRNTANAKGFKKNEMVVWDPLKSEGGTKNLSDARVILWKGFCHVHTFFKIDHVKKARKKYPGCLIAVHPECNEDIVNASDVNGSTSFLKKYVEEAKPGTTLIIGTEINMVSRLARKNPDKKVIPLARSLCPNMFKTSLADLCYTVERLPEINEMTIPEYISNEAKIALERMLCL